MEHANALSNAPKTSDLNAWTDNIQLAQRAISGLVETASSPVDPLKIDGTSIHVTDERLAHLMLQSDDAIQGLIDGLKLAQAFARRIRNISRRIVPINVLPIELLKMIFECGFEASALHPMDPAFDPLKGNISLQFRSSISLVCSRWRIVSLETRRLWTYVNLDEKWPPECVQTYIARSLPSALNVCISQDQFYRGAGWNESAQLLISNFRRWRSCDFRGDISLFMDILDKAPGDIIPSKMEHIGIYDQLQQGLIDHDGLWDAFWNNLPNLRSLCLVETHFPWSFPALDIVLSRLLHLDISGYPEPSGETLDLVLRNSHQLQSFRLWSYKSNDSVVDTPNLDSPIQVLQVPRITFSHLTSLSIQENSADCLHRLFRTSAPHLTSMAIDQNTIRNFPEAVTFIGESYLSLKTLHLFDAEYLRSRQHRRHKQTSQYLRSLLVLLTSLEVIHLFNSVSAAVRWALRPTSPGKFPCPNLREIHLHEIEDFDPSDLADVIDSRAQNGNSKHRSPVRDLDLLSITTSTLRTDSRSRHFYNHMAERAIERLGKHVKEIRWAGFAK